MYIYSFLFYKQLAFKIFDVTLAFAALHIYLGIVEKVSMLLFCSFPRINHTWTNL